MSKTTPKMYVADTENTVPRGRLYEDDDDAARNATVTAHMIQAIDEIEKEKRTRIWAAAIAPVKESPTEDDVTIESNMVDFISYLSTLPSGSEIYFHNLGYDGNLIISHLLSSGHYFMDVTPPENYNGRTPYQFLNPKRRNHPEHGKQGGIKTLISGDGAYYQIMVTMVNNGTTITLKDSLKILPFSVDAIGGAFKTKAKKLTGGIDYSQVRPENHVITEEERAYIVNDVLVMSEAIYRVQNGEADLTQALTIGSSCIKEFENTVNGNMLEACMPELDIELDEKLRKAYRGGFCYVNRDNPLIANNEIVDCRQSSRKGHTYDVNSLYPSVMVDRRMPVGEPRELTTPREIKQFDFDGLEPYFINFTVNFTIKPRHIPFIQLKGNSRFVENEYVTTTGGESENITLTGVDFVLFREHYDIHEFRINTIWVFSYVTDIFNDYIRYWTHIKENADNPVDYMIAKLMLNNLYGKMAQSMQRESGIPYIDDKGLLKLSIVEDEAKGGYIPIGAYITAYAREVTVRAAQANYDNFLYADTDSIHIIGEAVGIDVGPHLGQWDHEATWDIGRFVRQKTYMERVIAEERKNDEGVKEFGPVTPKLTIRAAGANQLVKDRLQHHVTRYQDGQWHHTTLDKDEDDNYINPRRDDEEIFERFTHGLSEAGKLARETVRGGAWLRETTWAITAPEGVHINPSTGLAPSTWSVVA